MGFFSKLFDDILGFDPPKAPPPAPLPIPPPTQISGEASDEIRRKKRARQSGRRQTIVTGDLTPNDPSKSNLLGRPA